MPKELLDTLIEEYDKVLTDGEFSDTEILVGKEPDTKVFKVHSVILKIRSPYFRAALSKDWLKKENDIIKLNQPNISVKIFDILIRYIYHSTINLSKKDLKTNVELLIAADELCLDDLCNYIEDYCLKDKEILKKNFVLIQTITTQFTHFKKLSKFYKTSFQADPALIIKADDFETIDHDALLDFLVNYNNSLNSIDIWDKLMIWCIAQSSNLPSETNNWTSNEVKTFGALINPFISYIDFKKIHHSDFFKKIKPFKDIFDTEFYVKILEHYSFQRKQRRQRARVSYLESSSEDNNNSYSEYSPEDCGDNSEYCSNNSYTEYSSEEDGDKTYSENSPEDYNEKSYSGYSSAENCNDKYPDDCDDSFSEYSSESDEVYYVRPTKRRKLL